MHWHVPEVAFVQEVCMCVCTEPEIMVGHWTFSDQKYRMSGHFEIWLDFLSGQIFGFLLIFKYFPYFTLFCLNKFLMSDQNQFTSDTMS